MILHVLVFTLPSRKILVKLCFFFQPRKVLLDQLSLVLSSDDSLPESFILVNANEWQGQVIHKHFSLQSLHSIPNWEIIGIILYLTQVRLSTPSPLIKE